MKKTSWSLLTLLFALMLVLAACGGGDKKEETNKGSDQGTNDSGENADNESNEQEFPLSVENEGEPIEGGTLMVAMQKDEPFQGVFSYALYKDGFDGDLLAFASNSIFEVDEEFMITDKGIATMEVTKAEKEGDPHVVTIKIRDGVKWSDGEPLTVEDLMLPYNIIGHKDYTGVRYDGDFRNIVGAEEYHDGKADTISGLVKVDEQTLELHLKEISASLNYGGGGLLTYAEPNHILKDIPVGELVEHDAIRKNPISLGAFVIDKVVPGESVQYVANENYWQGKPKLDGVIVKVVPSSSISKAIEAGEYDLVLSFGSSKYEEIENLTNIDVLARTELYYNYLGFKLGKWDAEKNEVVTDLENSKMGDKNLRHAMAYALNVEEVNEAFYEGQRERANAIIPPVFPSFHNKDLPGFTYDPEKANQLLDEAGYKYVNENDEFRSDKDGNPLEIKFATMTGDDVGEQVSAFWLENWADVGLNVTYTTGRTIEFNTFYEKVQADDKDIDIFMGAWGVGTNPSPAGVYSKTASFNLARFASDELEETIKNIDSEESYDVDYRASQFKKFEEILADEASMVPLQYRLELSPVNKRVKNYNVEYGKETKLHEIELTAEKPIK